MAAVFTERFASQWKLNELAHVEIGSLAGRLT